MKKLIKSGGPLPPYVKKAHMDNFKQLIARTDKIMEATRMKAARQTVQTLSYSGRSEGKMRSRLIHNFVCKTFLNEYVTTYSHIINYMTSHSHIMSHMTSDNHMLLSYDFT